jgi:peptide methionine sulfoxide reductase MsrA
MAIGCSWCAAKEFALVFSIRESKAAYTQYGSTLVVRKSETEEKLTSEATQRRTR